MTAADAENSTDAEGAGAPVPRSGLKRRQAKATITKTTVTPAPGSETETEAESAERPSLFARLRGGGAHGKLASARPPYPGANVLRVLMSMMLSALCLLTVGGAILMLLLWQQDRASGVLSSQLDRTWDLFDLLRRIERWVAFAVVPVAGAWLALAALNVRRATGRRRNPVVPVVGLVVGVAGVWAIGDRLVAESDDWLGQAAGFVLQAIFLAIPWLVAERLADAAESRHGPLRTTYLIAVGFVAHLQFLGGLSTVDQTAGPDEWGRLGAYLVIGALLQVLGSLAANEAARAIEDGTQHRFDLRNRFGESLLAQAARG